MTKQRCVLLAIIVFVGTTTSLFMPSLIRLGSITREFPAEGLSKVILRAAHADSAIVTIDPQATVIEVSGVPEGDAKGYHSPDPSWREMPATERGMNFVSARHGDVLIVSSKREIRYIHHYYALESLRIRVPPNIEVVRRARRLSGDGEPDLSPP